MTTFPQTKHELLQQIFGYDSFRPGQETIIDALLSGRDAMGIMPTGGGKSICYQIPALLLPGITLVVSPLISLMQDQVRTLVELGIRGAYLNGSLNQKQLAKALDNACRGVYKIIYVAPERLNTPSLHHLAESVEISMVCVDEAHCVSQWGQDFRPSYLEIPAFIQSLPRRPVVSAFTATATPRVRRDIISLLELEQPETVITGFDRPNLTFSVQEPTERFPALLRCLKEHEGHSGIVYCTTRKEVESVCDRLCKEGFSATRYHAGLPSDERSANQQDFLYDRKLIVVATNAFGMGIDKSNVSFVIHYNMPKDLESYYQEAGRAGRDGSPADCVLLFDPKDIHLNQFLIEQDSSKDLLDDHTREHLQKRQLARLRQMSTYATNSTQCLRAQLLTYFGETPPKHCKNCSVCLGRHRDPDAPTTRLRLPGWMPSIPTVVIRASDRALLARLKEERARLGRKFGLPPFAVLEDVTLRQMAVTRPTDLAQLLKLSGVTDLKLKRYGQSFLDVIAQFQEEDHV